jgi:hypothetical protein
VVRRVAWTVAALVLLTAAPAPAKELQFTAALRGDRAPTTTGSKATGAARIVVDTDSQAVDMTLDAFPAAYGPGYAATPQGFQVVMAAGAALLKSKTPFEDFVASLQHGAVVLNIHTNAQPDDEISGDVVPAAT